jgi:hypothetical protein
LNLSLTADPIKNIQWLFWAVSRVNTFPGSAVISFPQWSHGILHRGLAKILSWLDGSSFREHWSRHPLKYSYAFLTSILELFQVVVRWIQAVDDYDTLSIFVDAALPGVGITAHQIHSAEPPGTTPVGHMARRRLLSLDLHPLCFGRRL